MKLTPVFLASSVSILLLAGCSDNSPDDTGLLAPNNASLRVVDNSDEFYAALREGMIRTAGDNLYNGGFLVETTADANVAGGTTGAIAEADNSTSLPASNSSSVGREEITGTNVQEVGVDEADNVKADSSYLYILDNDDYVYTTDAVEIGIATDAAVFRPPGTGSLRILSLQPDAPDASEVGDLTLDFKGQQASGMYLHPGSNGQNVIVTSSGYTDYWSLWSNPYSFASQSSGITRIDVSDPSNATVAEQFVMDGQIISSRRIDSNLIVASRHYPSIEGVDPYTTSAEEYRAAVESADLSTVLPTYVNSDTGETTPLVNPAECFVAPKEGDDQYYIPNIVTLSIIDLNSMELSDSRCYMGSTETLYASPNAIYLATTRWNYTGQNAVDEARPVDPDEATVAIDFVDPRVNTDIHAFAINGSNLSYQGSGSVKGHLGWNALRKPFRMSEQNGYLRVATYSNRFDASISPINLTVLKPNGSGVLDIVSQIPNDSRPAHIGKPGEQLYASRYVGDKAYMVTFRQTDPLYVIDLSNPEDPYLAGELEIEGYSDYLQPISEDYLLGIGKDAVAADDGWGDGRGALTQGIKLALFDVSDASVPTEVQSLIIGQRGSDSAALYDHRAIKIQPATDQHPTRVAFSITVAGETFPTVRPSSANAWQWYEHNYSGLHGFDVRTGADAGITNVGALVPQDGSYWSSYSDRSVIYNDSVYYIRDAQVYAAPWNQLDNFVGPR